MAQNETVTQGEKPRKEDITQSRITVSTITNDNKSNYRTANIAKAREAKRKQSEPTTVSTQDAAETEAGLADEPPRKRRRVDTDEDDDIRNDTAAAKPDEGATDTFSFRDAAGDIISVSLRVFGACLVAAAMSYMRANLLNRKSDSEDIDGARKRWTQ